MTSQTEGSALTYPPSAAFASAAHIDAAKYDAMYAASISDPDAFWGEHGKSLDWIKPYTKVQDVNFALDDLHIRWFEDGTLNVCANCVDRHLATRCPLMCPTGTPWLFPQRDGNKHVDGGQLASRMLKRVRKEAGLHVNAHLYRHFAVMNWLDANPGGYEVARRLLGHSEVSRTINLYSGLEVKSATRAFADLIETTKRAR